MSNPCESGTSWPPAMRASDLEIGTLPGPLDLLVLRYLDNLTIRPRSSYDHCFVGLTLRGRGDRERGNRSDSRLNSPMRPGLIDAIRRSVGDMHFRAGGFRLPLLQAIRASLVLS
jgi:hypothetical protein